MAIDTSSTLQAASSPSANASCFAAWRRHFYAGLFVVPFLLVLTITGLIMRDFNSIETRFGERHLVDPVGDPFLVTAQAEAATALFPDGSLKQYLAPPWPDRAGLFSVDINEKNMVVAVNPYAGEALGSVEKDSTWF